MEMANKILLLVTLIEYGLDPLGRRLGWLYQRGRQRTSTAQSPSAFQQRQQTGFSYCQPVQEQSRSASEMAWAGLAAQQMLALPVSLVR
jgi:hypothetical protein